MTFRTGIRVFGWQIAGSLLLAALVLPAWGQQLDQQVSSRKGVNHAIATTPQTTLTPEQSAAVAEALVVFNFSSSPGESVGESKIPSSLPGPLQPMKVPEEQAPPRPRVKSSIKMPKLADPEQFKIRSRKSSGPWFNLQDEGTDRLPTLSEIRQKSQSSKPDVGDEGSLLGSLPKVNLRSGIAIDSMQRAVFNRDVPDPNLSFVAGATLASDYSTSYLPMTKTWRSPNMLHQPLYFEDENLERYGIGWGAWQPAISGFKFFTNIALLPYKNGERSPRDCVYSMGYFRPGDCNPAFRPTYRPISPRGVVYESIVVGAILTGL